jgi:hypothetical protein
MKMSGRVFKIGQDKLATADHTLLKATVHFALPKI